MTRSIALLGTGLMGSPMAANLVRAGFRTTVWNRTTAKTAAAQAAGASVSLSPSEAVTDAEIVVLVLENGPIVSEVLFGSGAMDRLQPGAVVVDCSSIAPELAREHAARLATVSVGHVDAPVSGGPGGAEQGSLAVMAGGSAEHVAQALPVLQVFGRVTHVGPSGAGQFAKLCSQWIAATAMAAVAETVLLARSQGIDPARIRDALTGGFADSKILQLHGARMSRRDFEPGGHIRTFVKDLDAAERIAAAQGLDLPVGRTAHGLFRDMDQRGAGDYDISALLLEMERRNETVPAPSSEVA